MVNATPPATARKRLKNAGWIALPRMWLSPKHAGLARRVLRAAADDAEEAARIAAEPKPMGRPRKETTDG